MTQAANPGSRTVAMVGLGAIGADLARRLAAGGWHVHGVDPAPAARERLAHESVEVHARLDDISDPVAALVCSLPSPEVLSATLLAPPHALDVVEPGGCVVDTSTNSLRVGRELRRAGERRGLTVVDAPVSGRVPALTAMAGCTDANPVARSILECVAAKVIYLGTPLAGYTAKLLHQYVFLAGVTSTAQALAASPTSGVGREALLAIMAAGSAQNRAARIFPETTRLGVDLVPSAPLSLLLKDLLLIEELDAELGLGLDLLEPMIARFRAAVAELGGNAPLHALVDAYRDGPEA